MFLFSDWRLGFCGFTKVFFHLQVQSNLCITINDHPWDPKIVVVVDRWLLLSGYLRSKSLKWDLKMVAVVDRWSLFGGGH